MRSGFMWTSRLHCISKIHCNNAHHDNMTNNPILQFGSLHANDCASIQNYVHIKSLVYAIAVHTLRDVWATHEARVRQRDASNASATPGAAALTATARSVRRRSPRRSSTRSASALVRRVCVSRPHLDEKYCCNRFTLDIFTCGAGPTQSQMYGRVAGPLTSLNFNYR